jgi:phage terminase small subunit
MTRKLNPKQEAFVREYLVDLAPSAAARRAGYVGNVKQTAYDLLRHPQIEAQIQAEMARRAERVEDSADEVLRDLRRIGQRAELLGEFAAALKSVELRGRHLGMFKLGVEVGGKGGGPIDVVTRVELVALQPHEDARGAD